MPLTNILHPTWHRPWSSESRREPVRPCSPALIAFAHRGLHSWFWGRACHVPVTQSSYSELGVHPHAAMNWEESSALWCKCGSQRSQKGALAFLCDLISETWRPCGPTAGKEGPAYLPLIPADGISVVGAQTPGNVYSAVSRAEIIWLRSAAEWRCQMVAGVWAPSSFGEVHLGYGKG